MRVGAAFLDTEGDLVLLLREERCVSLWNLLGAADDRELSPGVMSYGAVLHRSSFAISASCSC